MKLLLILAWLACGLLGGGMMFSYSQWEFSSIAKKYLREDFGLSIFCSLFGPIALIVGFLMTGFAEHGIWRPYRDSSGEQRS